MFNSINKFSFKAIESSMVEKNQIENNQIDNPNPAKTFFSEENRNLQDDVAHSGILTYEIRQTIIKYIEREFSDYDPTNIKIGNLNGFQINNLDDVVNSVIENSKLGRSTELTCHRKVNITISKQNIENRKKMEPKIKDNNAAICDIISGYGQNCVQILCEQYTEKNYQDLMKLISDMLEYGEAILEANMDPKTIIVHPFFVMDQNNFSYESNLRIELFHGNLDKKNLDELWVLLQSFQNSQAINRKINTKFSEMTIFLTVITNLISADIMNLPGQDNNFLFSDPIGIFKLLIEEYKKLKNQTSNDADDYINDGLSLSLINDIKSQLPDVIKARQFYLQTIMSFIILLNYMNTFLFDPKDYNFLGISYKLNEIQSMTNSIKKECNLSLQISLQNLHGNYYLSIDPDFQSSGMYISINPTYMTFILPYTPEYKMSIVNYKKLALKDTTGIETDDDNEHNQNQVFTRMNEEQYKHTQLMASQIGKVAKNGSFNETFKISL